MKYLLEFVRHDDGHWFGTSKIGYTRAQVLEEASDFYWRFPRIFPHGLRVTNRYGVVQGYRTEPTVTVLVLQRNQWISAPGPLTRSLDMSTAQRRMDELKKVWGADNVRLVNDTYAVELISPSLSAELNTEKVSA